MIIVITSVLGLIVAIVAMVRKPGLAAALLIFLFIMLLGAVLGSVDGNIRAAVESGTMQTCRTIALAEFQYANDHDGRYPDGKSSTEVFQKLLDGNYVSDPAMFYLPMAGKSSARGSHLEPENVCYDATGGISGTLPSGLPIVFITGFEVDYRLGGGVTRQVGPAPKFFGGPRTWMQWLHLEPRIFIPLARAGGGTEVESENDSLPTDNGDKLVGKNRESAGWIYHQLTPNGVLK
jgi:hypothetical protein